MTERPANGHPTGIVALFVRNAKPHIRLGLDIPSRLTAALEGSLGQLFTCELTEEGILFRPLPKSPAVPSEPPSWAKGEA